MATRRPIYRKEKPRSVSKTGMMLCLLLAGGVMLVPVGGDLAHTAKAKLRDMALSSGLVDFSDCVVTPDRMIDCTSHATGTPLSAALRQIEDNAAEAAAERQQRKKAESTVRELALEVERLSEQVKQAQLAAGAGSLFPPFSGDVRPTGFAGANPNDANVTNPAEAQPERPEEAGPVFSIMPPEGD
jgi:hypothetical protein